MLGVAKFDDPRQIYCMKMSHWLLTHSSPSAACGSRLDCPFKQIEAQVFFLIKSTIILNRSVFYVDNISPT